jgi:hypothetical protein
LSTNALGVVVASRNAQTRSLVAVRLVGGFTTIGTAASARSVANSAVETLLAGLTILTTTNVSWVETIGVFVAGERINTLTKTGRVVEGITMRLSRRSSSVQNSAGVIAGTSFASSIGLTIGSSGEGIASTFRHTEVVVGTRSLANSSVGVTQCLSGDFSSVGASTVGAGQSVSAVQARSIGLAIGTAGTSAISVDFAVFADSSITNGLVTGCSTIVSFAISSDVAGTAVSVQHTIFTRVTISVLRARSSINAKSRGGIANEITAEIESSAVVVRQTNNATSVNLTVRSTSGGSIGLAVRGSLFTAVSVGRAGSTTSSRANRLVDIREIAETVSFDTTEYARDTSSLPLYDGSSFDLIISPCVTSDVEINSGGREY